jgi:SAM-dependent methyltransferase
MPQKHAWEREYNNPQLITVGDEPQKDLTRFLKFLRRDEKIPIEGLRVLDLGSGAGKNALHLAELGAEVIGLEISSRAISIAQEKAREAHVHIDYRQQSIGEKFPFADNTFDLALDIMTSNSLTEAERKIYLSETFRTLKPGGYFFYRGLCKDGDTNAKNLIKMNPGREHDTYVNKDMGLTERVFTEKDLREMYGHYFTFLELIKKTNYPSFNGKIYKRNYWIAYLKRQNGIL